MEVVEVDAHCQHAAHDNAREHDARLADVEAIERTVHQGEHFEERVVNPVDESGVDVGEQYGWVLDHDFERFYQRVEGKSTGFQTSTVDLGLRADVGVLVEFAEAHRAAEEDVAG